jgi:hypothetical protein
MLGMTDITRTRLDRLAAAKAGEGVSPATVNRVMEVVRAILRNSEHDWEWIDRALRISRRTT